MKINCLYILLISLGLFHVKSEHKSNEYSVITWGFEIYDEVTKELIPNVTCYQEIYHEHVECQPELNTKFLLESYTELLKKKDLEEDVRTFILEEYDGLVERLKEEKQLNKKIYFDTLQITGKYTIAYGKPFKKYTARFEHKDYETVEIVDSFPICSMGISTKIGLKKK